MNWFEYEKEKKRINPESTPYEYEKQINQIIKKLTEGDKNGI